MIPYEVDPSLHNDKPHEPMLDDGFSPPVAPQQPVPTSSTEHMSPDAPSAVGEKSGF
jgi:hypothetical protein